MSAPVKRDGAADGTRKLNQRFLVAMVLYLGLAGLAWCTLGEGQIQVGDRLVEMRWIPLIVLGGMILKTWVSWQAEKIRRKG